MGILSIGESPAFVAFNAHCWFAAVVVHLMLRFGMTTTVAVVAAVGLAAFKEFFIDLRYETSPRQTLADSEQDFYGYCAGIAAGVFL